MWTPELVRSICKYTAQQRYCPRVRSYVDTGNNFALRKKLRYKWSPTELLTMQSDVEGILHHILRVQQRPWLKRKVQVERKVFVTVDTGAEYVFRYESGSDGITSTMVV